MTIRTVRADDRAIAELAVRAGTGVADRRASGAALDAATDVLLLGDVSGPGPDRTAAAGFLLAITRRLIVVPIIGDHQHPVNLARATATLSALHDRRLGLGAVDVDALALISRLWETWPLDSLVGDADSGRFVDDSRITRISDPNHPTIGGPLTLPVDVADKPVTVLLGSAGVASEGIDLVMDAATVPLLDAAALRAPAADAAEGAPRTARDLLGLAPSTPFATGSPAFADDDRRGAV